MFVDQQRQPGQRLRAFTVLGEYVSEGCRRFQVKLSLAEPDESRVVAYCVFGEDPMWVYRSEDFDLIMHWECPMPDDSPVPADAPRSGEEFRTGRSPRDRPAAAAPTGDRAG